MDSYAVIETGGKQYLVQPGDVVDLERLDGAAGDALEFERVLAASDGGELKVGSPVVEGAKVRATVQEQKRGPKVVAFKKKRRKGYRRKVGHRQELTRVKVDGIEC
ncbi:50S ribosomal protein L21 [Kiritimatiella glycovorans]|uniref:Large ribosomal subunit protein bL21 n=1 Tax=Kiritimatiella glycovorans TaxID=1307763 RepID=A0A0G3EAL6_9BACT|nr:50S ribosomal protein L21 [Kiritimatiella glycovorans]AKJ63511.1 50S ribosomal protein L21 [Kiritimatiella glycovorans]